MSLQNKLQKAAEAAAVEATLIERHRCCWVLDQILHVTRSQLDNKLLSVTQEHLVKLRAQLLTSLVASAKAAILTGARPPQPQPKEEADGTQAAMAQGRKG